MFSRLMNKIGRSRMSSSPSSVASESEDALVWDKDKDALLQSEKKKNSDLSEEGSKHSEKAEFGTNANEIEKNYNLTPSAYQAVSDLQQGFGTAENVCGICFELYTNSSRIPKVLACGHSYCLRCLVKVQETVGYYFPCPSCRLKNAKLVRLLPNNYQLKEFLNKLDLISDDEKDIASPVPEMLVTVNDHKENIAETLKCMSQNLDHYMPTYKVLLKMNDMHMEDYNKIRSPVSGSNAFTSDLQHKLDFASLMEVVVKTKLQRIEKDFETVKSILEDLQHECSKIDLQEETVDFNFLMRTLRENDLNVAGLLAGGDIDYSTIEGADRFVRSLENVSLVLEDLKSTTKLRIQGSGPGDDKFQMPPCCDVRITHYHSTARLPRQALIVENSRWNGEREPQSPSVSVSDAPSVAGLILANQAYSPENSPTQPQNDQDDWQVSTQPQGRWHGLMTFEEGQYIPPVPLSRMIDPYGPHPPDNSSRAVYHRRNREELRHSGLRARSYTDSHPAAPWWFDERPEQHRPSTPDFDPSGDNNDESG